MADVSDEPVNDGAGQPILNHLVADGLDSQGAELFRPHYRSSACNLSCYLGDIYVKSGREDSNLRPPAPKAGALARLRYAPSLLQGESYHRLSLLANVSSILTYR